MASYLLLEDGFHLVLEDLSGFLLLESDGAVLVVNYGPAGEGCHAVYGKAGEGCRAVSGAFREGRQTVYSHVAGEC